MYPFANTCHSREEILALGLENASMVGSPDLGPPPVSRFVDEDPIKVDSPCRVLGRTEATPATEEVTATSSPERLAPPKLDLVKRPVAEPDKKQPARAPKPMEPQAVSQPARPNSKRKFAVSDENGSVGGAKSADEKSSDAAETIVPIRELKNRRSYKELPLGRKESREKLLGKANVPGERKPLASKSTNDVVSSPRKVARTKPPAERAAGNVEDLKSDLLKERIREARRTVTIPTPEPPQVPTVFMPEPEPATHLVDVNLLPPDTPDRGPAKGHTRDTPPPADISSQGETSRGSRRARSAVSYAEPNLRDKMRRPTKELFDAVSGEGKFVQRSHKPDDKTTATSETPLQTPASHGVERMDPRNDSEAEALAKLAAARRNALSPLAQRESSTLDILSNTVVTARRKRPSSIGIRESLGPAVEPLKGPEQTTSDDVEDKRKRGPDPYEFTTSSPRSDVTGTPEEPKEDVSLARGSRTSRRSSGALQTRSYEKLARPPNAKKRASMAVPKKSSMLQEGGSDDENDDSYEPPCPGGKADAGGVGGPTVDRISRRRSMML